MRRMPVEGSTCRDNVSTARTCWDFGFHVPYFRQLAVETSSQEYWNVQSVLKIFILYMGWY